MPGRVTSVSTDTGPNFVAGQSVRKGDCLRIGSGDDQKCVKLVCITENSQENRRLLKTDSDDLEAAPPPSEDWTSPKHLMKALLAEAIGTFIIVIFGVGSVCTVVTTGAQQGLWQVAVVWGFGVTLAILCTGEASGAHLNPAVSLAFLLVRPGDVFSPRWTAGLYRCLLYMLAQTFGAVIGGAINLGVFGSAIIAFERAKDISRGQPGSELSAMMFGEYFPNPGFVGDKKPLQNSDISPFSAFCIEVWGTMIKCFVIFMLTHDKNKILGKASRPMVPYFIGFTVAGLISLYAPLTQAGWNPARDFGPRLVAAFAGWGEIAIPGPRGGFWVYILGPLVGGPIGAGLAEAFVFISL